MTADTVAAARHGHLLRRAHRGGSSDHPGSDLPAGSTPRADGTTSRALPLRSPAAPTPPPLTRGSSLREQAKPETPRPVVETPEKPSAHHPDRDAAARRNGARRQEQPGVKPEDQFGSEKRKRLVRRSARDGRGRRGRRVVGGVPGGVPRRGDRGGPERVRSWTTTPPCSSSKQHQAPVSAGGLRQEDRRDRREVEILIDASGRVVRARILRSVPLLDAAALQCVYEWVFRPAMKKGRPVPPPPVPPWPSRSTERSWEVPDGTRPGTSGGRMVSKKLRRGERGRAVLSPGKGL